MDPSQRGLTEICVHVHVHVRQVTGGKAKSGAVVKHQRKDVVLKTTSNVNRNFKSGCAPLYRSLVTSLTCTITICIIIIIIILLMSYTVIC